MGSTWNEVFAAVGPTMIDEVNDRDFRGALENLIADRKASERSAKTKRFECRLSDRCLGTVIVQLRALGLIAKSTKRRSLKDTHTYWTLTPYGDNVMTRLRAIHRNPDMARGLTPAAPDDRTVE
jgi:hypothetical protein